MSSIVIGDQCSLYRLIIFRKSLFSFILQKNLRDDSTQQYCHVEFMVRFLDKLVKFGYSEKATKFEKIFHLKLDVTA